MSAATPSQHSRLDPEPLPRRDFLGLAALWTSFAAMLAAAAGMLRLPRAAVVSSPSKIFKVELPENLSPGQPFVPAGRAVAIYRDDQGVWAVSTVCTHLGCIVKPDAEGFGCPCHGSRFTPDGEVLKGPAPQALPWRKVSGASGAILVDEDATVPTGTKVKV
jgi:cytochrome b6-f complex iron-sulfur subunit